MLTLLVGARGFLGCHVHRRLLAAGQLVLPAGRGTQQVRLDLASDSVAAVAAILRDLDPAVIVNCAGAVAGDIDTMVAVNVGGPRVLLDAMVLAGSKARFVHVGSAAEYGRVEPGRPVTEQTPPRPVGSYGRTKLAGTELVAAAHAAGADAVALRVFDPVGPGAPRTSLAGRLAAELAARLRGSGPVDDLRLGPLDAVRDFTDARDVADAVAAAVMVRSIRVPVLNIGSGRGVPTRTLVEGLLREARFRGRLYEDAPSPPLSAEVPWQQADISAAQRTLGWFPRTPLDETLADLWASVAWPTPART